MKSSSLEIGFSRRSMGLRPFAPANSWAQPVRMNDQVTASSMPRAASSRRICERLRCALVRTVSGSAVSGRIGTTGILS